MCKEYSSKSKIILGGIEVKTPPPKIIFDLEEYSLHILTIFTQGTLMGIVINKFPDFKIDYHSDNLREHFGVEPEKKNRPLEVDANYEQVRSSVLQSIDEISNLKT